MEITFLGTGSAWGLPELNCNCLVCREMRRGGEKRKRTALLLSSETTLLMDCGPDVRSQLLRNHVDRIDAVLITHEHGDHYLGLDELLAYQRNCPRGTFHPVPVYLTALSWEVIGPRFAYLEEMKVIQVRPISPGEWFKEGAFEVFPFTTEHGSFAKGSVGFVLRAENRRHEAVQMVYTSDFTDIPVIPREVMEPDYLVIQSFWFNEPARNRPNHMSFQRALHFIEALRPKRETFLVHMGDADMIPGDPCNDLAKKKEPKDPLRPPFGGEPYPVPLNQMQWQETVERIMRDRGLPYRVTVAYDDLRVTI